MSEQAGGITNVEELNAAIKWDANGLVPAIVQDAVSKEVLMMAYMNQDSLKLTIESGETWFWSRSRNELWHKGATSGHTQKVKALRYDCDGDTLLVLVDQAVSPSAIPADTAASIMK